MSVERKLLLAQRIDLQLDEDRGSARISLPGHPVAIRVTVSATAGYRDQVLEFNATGAQVDLTGITLDEAWLCIHHLESSGLGSGELSVYDGDPAGAGNEIGVIFPGEIWGPLRVGADLSQIWLKAETTFTIGARVVVIEK